MKISILIITIISSITSVYSQSNIVSDSLLLEVCRAIVENKNSNDSIKVDDAFNSHLVPVLSKLNDSAFNETYNYLFFRLQKFCPEFKKYLDKINPPKDDWISLETKPSSKLDKASCRGFQKHKNYYYFEQNGDTVHLSLQNNFWVDHFRDGTYSKLKLNWTNDCAFEIIFIESTNQIRKSISKPGDKYRYELIEKHPDYYLVCLDMRELNILGTFRIYYH